MHDRDRMVDDSGFDGDREDGVAFLDMGEKGTHEMRRSPSSKPILRSSGDWSQALNRQGPGKKGTSEEKTRIKKQWKAVAAERKLVCTYCAERHENCEASTRRCNVCETKNVKCSLRDLFQRWLAVELLQDWTELEWAMAEVAYSPSPSDRSKSLVGDAGDLVTPRPRSPSPSTSGIRLSARRSKRHHPNGSEERSPITEGPSPPPSAISLRSVPPPYSPSFSAPPNKRRRMSFDPAADSRSHRAVSPTGSLSGSAVPQYPQINEVHGSCSVSVAPAQSARSLPAYPPPGFSPALFSYDEDGQDSDRETNVPSPPATPAGSVAFEQIDDPAGDYQPPPDEDGSAGLLDSGQPVPPTDDLSGDTSSPSLDIEAISRFLNCYLPRPEHLVFDMEAPLKLELLRVNSLGQEWSQYADYVELVASSTAQFCFNLGRDLYNAQTELRSAQEDHRLVEGRLRARIRELEDDASRRDEEVDHLAAHGAELEATIRRLRAENEIDGLRERLDSALRTLQNITTSAATSYTLLSSPSL